MSKERFDIHQHITDKIVSKSFPDRSQEALESGRPMKGGSEASLGQPSFLVHRRHQPDGEISPATSLQWLGAMKELHPAHAWPPFGVGWYCAALCGTLPAAVAPPNESAAGAELSREIRTFRRFNLCIPNVSCMSLLLLPALPHAVDL